MRKEYEGKTVKFFNSQDSKFVAACESAGIKATKRQASKWLMCKGKAYKEMKGV